MLKILPTFSFTTQTKTKCGEIFCHNATEFTVYCTFCEMKSFSFDDFLWHLKNLHFSADLLKSEIVNKTNSTVIKPEQIEEAENGIFDDLIHCYDDDNNDNDRENQDSFGDDEFCDNDSYEEPLAILKTKRIRTRPKRCKTKVETLSLKSEQSDDGDFNGSDSDEDFQPLVGLKIQCLFNVFVLNVISYFLA